MSEPKRYDLITTVSAGRFSQSDLVESKDGNLVSYEDYASLKAEVERLTKAGDEMEKVIWLAECIAGVEHTEKSCIAWLDAKEGKQS